MLDRAKIIDENFIQTVANNHFPPAKSLIKPEDVGLSKQTFIDLFTSQLISRQLDIQARKLKEQNLSYYTIGSSGHEGNAALGHVFRHTDMAFLHYRSCAFVVERHRKMPDIDAIENILLSLVASKLDPISAGRHKVFGSVPLFIPPQTSTIASHLPKALGAAVSITRAKELAIDSELPEDSVILASFGDASLNHACAQTTFNAAQWIAYQGYPLPLIFICEDNGTGISVPTPANWVEDTFRSRPAMHYLKADGLNLADVYRVAQEADNIARNNKQPVFLHIKCVRLMGHAGSDIESQYLTQEQIEQTEFDDPLLHSARALIENAYMQTQEIIDRYLSIADQVERSAKKLSNAPKLVSSAEVMASIIPKPKKAKPHSLPTQAERQACYADLYPQLRLKRNLSQQINFALIDIMLRYNNVLVFGEDVAQKGGVYRVTNGLTKRFSPRRVFNTLLDETTILGTAMGFAHNGFIPIPEIQFLAYFHNAEDQLRGEAATLSYFSNGQYSCPMVIRIAGFAYQKGFGGHFHNDNSIAVLRDIPGIIIACPSNGADAAKMLRRCVELAQYERRVVVFLEPIALYMTKDLHQKGDNAWLFNYPEPDETIALGELGVYGTSDELTIITYANGYYLSRQAAKILNDEYDIAIKIIDLRWLAPLNEADIIKQVKNCKNILIVDECRKTGSISEALVTLLLENLKTLPKIKRITGDDTFIPLGEAWKYVLPSKETIIRGVLDMLEVESVFERINPK